MFKLSRKKNSGFVPWEIWHPCALKRIFEARNCVASAWQKATEEKRAGTS